MVWTHFYDTGVTYSTAEAARPILDIHMISAGDLHVRPHSLWRRSLQILILALSFVTYTLNVIVDSQVLRESVVEKALIFEDHIDFFTDHLVFQMERY